MRIRETLKTAILVGALSALPAGVAFGQSTAQPAQPEISAQPQPGKLPGAIKAPGKAPAAPGSTAGAPDKTAGLPIDKKLIGLPVYTSDGKRIGRVSAVAMGTDGKVKEIHAKVGGFFGLGAKLVRIAPDEYEQAGKRVQLSLNSKQAGELPKVATPSRS